MNNKIYYVNAEAGKFPEAIKQGLFKALVIAATKEFRNVKLVLSHLNLLDSPPNFISQALDQLYDGDGTRLCRALKKERAISLIDIPKEGERTGINVLSTMRNFPVQHENTVALLVWADNESFKSLVSQLFFTHINIVAVVFNEEDRLNELISATKAEIFPAQANPPVSPYTDELDDNQRQVIARMKSINVTSSWIHEPTRERMKSVIDELKEKQLQISYEQFLGYLVNEVNFELKEAVALVDWQHHYFGR